MRASLVLVLGLLGCPGKSTDEPTDPDPPTVDTDIPPGFGGNEGGISLVRRYSLGQLEEAHLYGVFTNDAQGFVNLAQCALDPSAPCLRAIPARGMRLPFQPIERFTTSSSFYQHVGLRIRLGDYLSYYEVGDDLSYYTADLTDEPAFSGPADLRLGGVEWGPFELDAAVDVPTGFELLLPFSEATVIAFSDDTGFPLAWIPDPTTDADVVIIVRNVDEEEDAIILRVADTGSYALDLTSLGIVGDQELLLSIGRWTLDEFDVNGSTLTVQTTAETLIEVDYRDIGLREPVEVRETCAIEPPRLPLGRYYGDLTLNSDDYQEVVCLQSFDAANGSDGVFTLVVPPRTETVVEYRQLDANASMYLLDGCDPGSACVKGADTNSGQGPERLQVFNESATEELKYTLVLDAADAFTGGLFFVDHTRTPLPEPDWADTCLEALAAPELAPGRYYAAGLDDYADVFDAGFTGCTGSTLGGPDGLLPITIPAGASLEVTMSMEDANPALLIVSDCSDLATCVAGADQPGDIEVLVYPNPTGADLPVFLMLDTAGGSGPYFLTVNIN